MDKRALERRAAIFNVESSPRLVGATGTPTEALGTRCLPAVQPEAARRVFPGHPDQVAKARHFVRVTLGEAPVVDEAVLLVSELCTNALLHTASGHGGTFEVVVCMHLSWVRIEVRDEGAPRPPVAWQSTDTFAEDGRGLGLVELLADRWGHSGEQAGRSVFFELHWRQPG
jgi:anti-sigma regulatory factor (Ser/Thr protein kinase)